MKYVSTRNTRLSLDFCNAILSGLSEDGGLYMPEEYPRFSEQDIRSLRGLSYEDIALFVIQPFIEGEISSKKLKAIIGHAYRGFRHTAITPLVQMDKNNFVLELFHGPTLSFKDIAMQLLAGLIEHILEERDQYTTIVGATSGDTGAAAIEAFAGRKRTNIFILFPKDRISLVQQKQMTTSRASNAHVIAIDGSFDDCQRLVKELFADVSFRKSVNLSGINSINWARIMAQIVYYFVSSVALGAPDRSVSFSVPTGNFGDIFAGYSAILMGLPLEKLIIATNDNDTLVRMLETGIYKPGKVKATTSPAMDIQISSNLERLLFEVSNKDSLFVREVMETLKNQKHFQLSSKHLKTIRRFFSARSASENIVNDVISSVLEKSNYLVDPHTAIGIYAASRYDDISVPTVILSTAHPAKFPDVVEKASGVTPILPKFLEGITERFERFEMMDNDIEKIKCFINSRKFGGKN
ncbi:threonine synthase [Candidatus Liberibacter sp.]|uniref:threonine synthase n=1 Tax=Candidatus Liberibacter sp. TaxID=34022 RepID=UPI0015F74662|nr:threonine synthase [Candidatus Liberibacter sp.]MBA5723761.1 threonine synthase [Candidatus Liberibacter sp.]